MKRFLFVIVLLAFLTPTMLHAQEPGPAIVIKPENRCSPYNRDHYPYSQSVEDSVIARMGGRIYSPYTGESFASKRETDIEHIVAVSEAHDSGLCAASTSTRRSFAQDLDNLTLASPTLNRYHKVAKDVAEWLPVQNQCWFVARVLAVKKKYNLTMDIKEATTALNVLADCSSIEMMIGNVPLDITKTEPTQISTPTVARFIVSGANAVNVRSGPGTAYPVIGGVKMGESYPFNGKNAAGSWIRFPYRGSYGWVADWLMTVTGIEIVPIVQSPVIPTNAPAPAPMPRPFMDKDCADFATQSQAQEFFIAQGGPSSDPHRLDGDNDGIACEHLPKGSSSSASPTRCPNNCTEAHAMGMSNMTSSHRCWQSKFDRDRDGIGCER